MERLPPEAMERLRTLAAAITAEPGSIPHRLDLAWALREAARTQDAIEVYRGVALAYAEEGRIVQAIAVCKAILEIDPEHRETLETLAALAQRRGSRSEEAVPQEGADGSSTNPAPVLDTLRDLTPLVPVGAEVAAPPADEAAEELRAAQVESAEDGSAPEDAGALDDNAFGAAVRTPIPSREPEEPPPPFPLLSDLPRPALLELIARLRVVRFGGGVTVLEEGAGGEACYLIASGSVRIKKGAVEVARLGAGSFFGEFAVLCDQRRHASVETLEPVELLEISRALLDELVASHPGMARTLRRFYEQRLLETLLATAPFFAELRAQERTLVVERFRPRRFARGARIVEEGTPGGGLYLILVGEVEIVRGQGEDEILLGCLGEGSYFGEMSLLKGGVASATVRASRLTEAVQLPPRDFYELTSQHPVLWDQLRSEAQRRELANHAILAGEARESEDGTIYLV